MKKLVTLVSLVLVLSMILAACAPKATPAATVAPTEAPVETAAPTEAATEAAPAATLTIWADDTRAPVLLEFADEFKAEYNVELIVEDLGRVQDIRTPMITAAPAGEGPDIFVSVHDWLGAMIESGLVAPIDLGDKAAEFVPSALEAYTYTDGLLYGVPYATENLGFFYNTDMIETPPATWDEMLELARPLKEAGTIDYAIAIVGDPGYNSLPMQTAFGGYVFGKDEAGALNAKDLGLDSEGEIASITWMKAAVDEGLMPATTDFETNLALFLNGKMPFVMAGPWSLDAIRSAGVPYKVADAFPAGPAGAGNPFSGVQGFMINAFSKNQLLAQTFLTEYVSTPEFMQKIYELGNRTSAYTSVMEATSDPDLAAMGLSGVNAIPMPNIPEMGSVWTAWNNGIALALTGDQTPEASMQEASTQIRNLILGALAGMVNLPGTFQSKVGCGADWDPACEKSAMIKGEDGKYTFEATLPAGDYEYKVAMDGAWTLNYGSDGAENGPNYTLSLAAETLVTFTYDPETHLVTVAP